MLIPHTPNTLTSLFDQLRSAIVTGTELTRRPDGHDTSRTAAAPLPGASPQ